MATARHNNTAMVLGVVRRNRRSLMMGTALQATVMLVLALPADAQPAPNARPAGGTVVGGSATISGTTGNTQIDQASQRAAIDWRSFDVGSQQRVTFNQPAASAVVLNRVTGPDPSQIAGRIDANGQFILVNQSGVNFYKGAQVNAAGVMVSAANISNANFMAGVMKFDDKPANPNAKIDNQGTITVQQAGLAALVAPQVANSGTISAKLGHVVLAGAKTATLDLFGDGLLSLDVTNQVTQAPVGKDGKAATALVTNTGTIIADGGTVQLTARAADGIVQSLVQAGGTIRAATMGDQTGVVALNGVGGSIVVEGQLSAPGSAPGTKGGAIEIASDRNVVIAASANINASGASGGGLAAIGTTLARAKGGKGVTPTVVARNVTVQRGATVAADATASGRGGNVTLLSTDATQMDGLITVRGGAQGGNGGLAEVSGGAVSLTGHVDATAPLGLIGTLLLDPLDLFVSDVQPDGTFSIPPGPTVVAGGSLDAVTSSWISPASLAAQIANISLSTTRDLFVDNPIVLTGTAQSLTLQAGRNLTIATGATVTTAGDVLLKAATAQQGVLTVNAAIQSSGLVFLSDPLGAASGGSGIVVTAPVTSTRAGTLGGPLITVACDCFISIGNGSLNAGLGTVEFGPSTNGLGFKIGTTQDTIFAGLYRFGQTHDPITGAPSALAGNLTMGNAATVLDFHQMNLELDAGGSIVQLAGSSMQNVANLSGQAGTFATFDKANTIASLGPFTAAGALILNTGSAFAVGGPVTSTGNITLTAGTGGMQITSDVTTGTGTIQITSGGYLTQSGASSIFSGPDGTVAVNSTGDLIQSGTARIFGDTVNVSAGGKLQQSDNAFITTVAGGKINTNTVTTGGDLSQTGNGAILAVNALKITTGGNLTQTDTASILSSNSSATLSVKGAIALSGSASVTAPTISLTSGLGGITLTGNARMGQTGGAIDITSAGPVSEAPASTMIANSMTSSGGVSANVSLLGTSNAISVFHDFATNGDLVLVNGADLTLFGPLKANNLFFEVGKAGGTLTLGIANDAAPPSPTALPATLNAVATGGRISLVADNYAVLPTGVPPSSSITTNVGTVELAPFSAIATSLSGSGGLVPFIQTGGGTLEVGGFTNVPAGATTSVPRASSINIAGALALDTATAASLRLDSTGSITQTGGPLTVANLAGSAGTFASLTQPANQIDTLGAFSSGSGFALVNNKPLLVAGPVTDTGGASTLALTTRTGDIKLAGNVSATNVMDLISAGAINQTGGFLVAGTLTGSAATSASLTQSANQVDTLGAFSTTAGFALVNNKALLVTGPVQDTGGASTLALTTRTGDITLAGNVSATNVVDLISAGAINQTGGSLAARTLTGSAGSSAGATLTSDNAISFFGPFTATSGVIDLVDSIPLTIHGALTARLIFITATGSISLASDITTGGLASFTTVPTDPLAGLGGAFFVVLPDASGKSSFTANSNVSPLDGTGTVMVVSMPPQGGNVGLTNLNAPGAELLLSLGSGDASGQVSVGSLFVLGAGGRVNFTSSTVQGFTGSAAALAAQSFPPANPAYLLNGCEIGVGCNPPTINLRVLAQGVSVSSGISNIVASLIQNAGVAPIQSTQEANPRGVPILNPMRDLSGGPLRDRQSDPDLLLPNVSEKDY